MITVRFSDGLGNQLFQYATARALAERHGTEVLGDIVDYGFRFPIGRRPPKRSDRPFDLARLAPPHLRYQHGLAGYIAHRRAKLGKTYVQRDRNRFEPAVLDLPDGTVLVGHFQSERYFGAITDVLRRELTPADPQIRARAAAAISAARRLGRPLVSVHVRRGDYLHYDRLVIEVERIRAAMERLGRADLLVFSDDMPWCRSALTGESVSFSDFTDPLEDFHAMGLCDHHIIANSTFSWWAAWLAWRPGKRVLAPTDWYGRYPERRAGDEDIYAAGWERY